MKSLKAVLVVGAIILSNGAYAELTPITDTVTIGDKVWAQPILFQQEYIFPEPGLTWSEVSAQCPSGVCGPGAQLNGYDLEGWTWASNAEVFQGVFMPYGIPYNYSYHAWGSNEFSMPWHEHPLLTLLQATGFRPNVNTPIREGTGSYAPADSNVELGGWTRDVSTPPEVTPWSYTGLLEHYGCSYDSPYDVLCHPDISARLMNGNYSTGYYAQYNYGGAWFYRVASVDADGDSVLDNDDNCPAVANADQVNSDGDALGDACDGCPIDPDNDADGDGFCGNVDNCPAVANASQADVDDDDIGDACDPEDNDSDRDGVWNSLDNCPADANADQANTDGDVLGDVCDVCPSDANNDADGDGVCGDIDNCPVVTNASQVDADNDGIGDACDTDNDSDGVADDVDNCPLIANPGQADLDGDGAGDACDRDADSDGVTDATDACLGTATGAVVNASGCTIAQLSPCDNTWKNKGAYVKSVTQAAHAFKSAGLIDMDTYGAIVSNAATSSCGTK